MCSNPMGGDSYKQVFACVFPGPKSSSVWIRHWALWNRHSLSVSPIRLRWWTHISGSWCNFTFFPFPLSFFFLRALLPWIGKSTTVLTVYTKGSKFAKTSLPGQYYSYRAPICVHCWDVFCQDHLVWCFFIIILCTGVVVNSLLLVQPVK